MMFTTSISLGVGRRRRHLAVTRSYRSNAWCLQWADPSPHGYKYELPLIEGIPTRKKALEMKAAYLHGDYYEACPCCQLFDDKCPGRSQQDLLENCCCLPECPNS